MHYMRSRFVVCKSYFFILVSGQNLDNYVFIDKIEYFEESVIVIILNRSELCTVT